MITMSKLDIKQPDGSSVRVHFAIQYTDYNQLERLVRRAMRASEFNASDNGVTVNIIAVDEPCTV